MTRTTSPGSSCAASSSAASSGGADQLVGVVVAGRLADADQQVDPGPRARARRPRGGSRRRRGRARPSRRAPRSGARPRASRGGRARPASRPGWRCSSRSRGRSRRPARGARRGSARSLSSQRDRPSRPSGAPSATPGRDRRQGVGQVVGLGEGEVEALAPAGVAISASVTPSATRPRPPRRRRPPRSGAAAAPRRRCGSSSPASTGTTRGAVRGQRREHLGLGRRDRLHRAEQLDVDRPDVGDHRDVGLGDRRQLGDLAGAAHRHLEHQHVGLRRRLEHRQRQPDLGVEVLAAGVDARRAAAPGRCP